MKIKLKSVIKCPVCKYSKEVSMALYVRRMMYDCDECKARLKPKAGDCCVFCTYGSVPCPTTQQEIIDRSGNNAAFPEP